MEWLDSAALSALVAFTLLAHKTAPLCGFIAGFSGVKTYQAFAREEAGWLHAWGGLFAVAVLLGPVAFVGLPYVVAWFGFEGGELPTWQGYVHAVGFALGVVSVFAWGRYASPRIEAAKSRLTRRSELERNQRTDVREIAKHLPNVEAAFDPVRFMAPEKGVFLGLDENDRPQYIATDVWRRSHVQVIGTSGAGKGVATAVLLSQAVRDGEAVVVIDPKNDEWAPHVLRRECERQGVPFALVDLRSKTPQIDLFDGATADQLEELLVAGFSLSERGDAADFYRLGDRQTARLAGQVLEEDGDGSWTVRDLADHPAIRKAKQDAPGFVGKLDELARVGSVTKAGARLLSQTVRGGGCLYVIGSMRNERVRIAQRMLLVRLLQIVESRNRITETPRPVCCFLDELKYHLSRPALEGLGAARDKGLHFVLAHQSLADLRDCPADLDGDAVVGAVVENCALRIAYRVRDPETAQWLAAMSGSILVDDESRRIERNLGLAELVESERTVRLAERYLVDVNMLLNLPPRVAVVYGQELPRFAHICPLAVQKAELLTVALEPVESTGQEAAQEAQDEAAAPAPQESQPTAPNAAPWSPWDGQDAEPEDEPEPEPLTMVELPADFNFDAVAQPTVEPEKPASRIQTIRAAGDLPNVDF